MVIPGVGDPYSHPRAGAAGAKSVQSKACSGAREYSKPFAPQLHRPLAHAAPVAALPSRTFAPSRPTPTRTLPPSRWSSSRALLRPTPVWLLLLLLGRRKGENWRRRARGGHDHRGGWTPGGSPACGKVLTDLSSTTAEDVAQTAGACGQVLTDLS